MTFEFACPECAAEIRVPVSAAGKKGTCPQCQTRLTVPHPEAVAPPAPSSAGPVARGPATTARPPATAPAHTPYGLPGTPTSAPAAAPAPEAAAPAGVFEFPCGQCGAGIRVSTAAVGKTGTCPQCQTRLQVPDPRSVVRQPPVAHAPPRPPAQALHLPDFDQGLVSYAGTTATSLSKAIEKKRRVSSAKYLVPVVFLLIAAGAVAGVMWNQGRGPSGELTGERFTEPESDAQLLDLHSLNVSKETWEGVLKRFGGQPIELQSELVQLVLTVQDKGVEIIARPGPGMSFVRVLPEQNKAFQEYVSRHGIVWDKARRLAIAESLPAFAQTLVKLSKTSNSSLPQAKELRDNVLLPSLVEGLGFHVQAGAGRETFPCAFQDDEGALYFLVPAKVKRFEIQPRTGVTTKPAFNGRYQVAISSKTTQRPEDKKKKKPADEVKGPKKEAPGLSEIYDSEMSKQGDPGAKKRPNLDYFDKLKDKEKDPEIPNQDLPDKAMPRKSQPPSPPTGVPPTESGKSA